MKITKLTAENVKRLTAVEMTPDGNLVIVGGKNGVGKSSLLDSIMYALAGASSIPSQPIRNGTKAAKITLELDGEKTLTVERIMSPRGGSLVVRATGKAAPLSSPQAVLDSLCGKIAFDPLEFTRLKPREQLERLRNLVGLDFAELDRERESVFAERTQINRDAKAMKVRIDAIATSPGGPTDLVSIADLMEELNRRRRINQDNDDSRRKCQDALHMETNQHLAVRAAESQVNELEEKLREARRVLAEAQTGLELATDWKRKSETMVAGLQDADVPEIEQQIASAESVNLRIRARQEREHSVSQWEAKVNESEQCSRRLVAIDADKQRQMEHAAWPVPDLGFDLDGVTYNGLPFDQAGSAEALKVSVAIGAAFNPVLRVMLIRDGSLLDSESLATIATLAEERDLQLWIERVGEGEECSVIISDGTIKAKEEG